MRSAFKLLATAKEPTIADYPIDAPYEEHAENWVCPVSFPGKSSDSLTDRLIAEVDRLLPWARETQKSRGRSLFGVTGAESEQVESVARALAQVAESGDLFSTPQFQINWRFEMPYLIRHLAEDLRVFYHEAVAAQPGPTAPNHRALTKWMLKDTVLGEVLLEIGEHLTKEGSPDSLLIRGFLIPEGFWKGGSAFGWREGFYGPHKPKDTP